MTVPELYKLVAQIVSDAALLRDRHTNANDAPVNYACVFSQSDAKYEELLIAARAVGEIVKETPTGPLFHVPPISTVAGPLKLIKIRTPDPTRPERGDADFTVSSYPRFKSTYLSQSGFTLIERPDFEMIELLDAESDVRVYFSYPPLDQQLGIS